MVNNILVYWHGIIGIPGKGPNWIEKYDPNKTIGDIINSLKTHKLCDGKSAEILKFHRGNLSKFDKNDLWWNHNTRMSEYYSYYGPYGNDVMLVYYCV